MTHEQELEMLKDEVQRQEGVQMEDIRPSMTEDDRQKALSEILRVLRGDQ